MFLRFGTPFVVLTTVVALAGCESGTRGEEPPLPPVAAQEEPGTPMMAPDDLGLAMNAHLHQMETADGAAMQGLLPQHRDFVTAMIEECKMMMQQMGMREPAVWTSLESELRQDIDRMVTMEPQELEAFFPEHASRVEQMMEMRSDMMGSM